MIIPVSKELYCSYMANIRHSTSSILTVVIFLVLTAIASIIYSGDAENRSAMEDNGLYIKSQMVIGTVFSVAQKLAEFNLDRNIGFGEKIKNHISELDLENINLSDSDKIFSQGYWSKLLYRLVEEWKNDGEETDQNNFGELFSWQKTSGGREILLILENKEYRLILPSFDFLSQ